MPGESCCKQLHQMRGHGRAVVAMHGRNGRSSGMRFEVHSALPSFSFTSVVPTTALEVAMVLLGPRTITGHRHLELFVLIGSVGRLGECREDQNE